MAPPSRFRRRVRLVVVATLLGIASTVVAAWLFAVLPLPKDASRFTTAFRSEPTSSSKSVYNRITMSDWAGRTWYGAEASEPSSLMVHGNWGRVADHLDVPWSLRSLVLAPSDEAGVPIAYGDTRYVIACGWPMRAMACGVSVDTGKRTAILAGWPLPSGLARWFEATTLVGIPLLPTRPIWGGFMADAALYGAAWLALLAGPGALRRAVRRRRGGCPACGYDLRGSPEGACPECGAAAPDH